MNIINLSNKNFIKVLLNTALPITVQHFIGYALNAMDTIMVGQLGEIKIASVGIANQVFLILLLFLCGISNSGAVFIAQFHSKNEAIGIKKYLALMLFINIVIALLFIIFVITAPHLIMGIFSQDYQVISSGVEYLKTVAFSYLFTSISVIYISALRSSNEVKVTIFTSFISLLLDTLLSYLFIFGKLGLPTLGIKGAAIATVISRCVELLLIITFINFKKKDFKLNLNNLTSINYSELKTFFIVAMPLIFSEIMWILGTIIHSIIYARMGTEVIAAINIVLSVQNFVFFIFLGLSETCAIVLGQLIGTSNFSKAYDYANKFLLVSIFISIFISFIIFNNGVNIIKLFNVSEPTERIFYKIIVIFSFMLWSKVINLILTAGIMRSGGDTRFVFLIDAGGTWLIGVPLAVLSGIIFHLPIDLVYFAVFLEEVAKCILGFKRLVSKKWLKTVKNF